MPGFDQLVQGYVQGQQLRANKAREIAQQQADLYERKFREQQAATQHQYQMGILTQQANQLLETKREHDLMAQERKDVQAQKAAEAAERARHNLQSELIRLYQLSIQSEGNTERGKNQFIKNALDAVSKARAQGATEEDATGEVQRIIGLFGGSSQRSPQGSTTAPQATLPQTGQSAPPLSRLVIPPRLAPNQDQEQPGSTATPNTNATIPSTQGMLPLVGAKYATEVERRAKLQADREWKQKLNQADLENKGALTELHKGQAIGQTLKNKYAEQKSIADLARLSAETQLAKDRSAEIASHIDLEKSQKEKTDIEKMVKRAELTPDGLTIKQKDDINKEVSKANFDKIKFQQRLQQNGQHLSAMYAVTRNYRNGVNPKGLTPDDIHKIEQDIIDMGPTNRQLESGMRDAQARFDFYSSLQKEHGTLKVNKTDGSIDHPATRRDLQQTQADARQSATAARRTVGTLRPPSAKTQTPEQKRQQRINDLWQQLGK